MLKLLLSKFVGNQNSSKPLASLLGICYMSNQVISRKTWFISTFLGASPFHSAQYVGKDQQPWLLQVGKALKGAQTWPCAVLDYYYSYFSIPGCFDSLSQYSEEMVCKTQQHLPPNFLDYRKCNCTKQVKTLITLKIRYEK